MCNLLVGLDYHIAGVKNPDSLCIKRLFNSLEQFCSNLFLFIDCDVLFIKCFF